MNRRIPEDAFETYVAMGAGRSYRALAQKIGVSKRAVTKRASKEGWNSRLLKIEEEARHRTDRRLAETMEEMRSRHLKILRAMQGKALETLKSMPLTSAMEAVRTLEISIAKERLISGEPSERTESLVEEVTRSELRRWLVPSENGNEEDDD